MAKQKLNNVDLYQMKTLSARVKEYGDASLWGAVIRKRYQARITALNDQITYHKNQRDLIKSGESRLMTLEENANWIVRFTEEKQALLEEMKALQVQEATFALTAGDLALYKSYKNHVTDREALLKDVAFWFLPYCSETAKVDQNTALVHNIVDRILSYEVATTGMARARQAANGKAVTWTKTVRSQNGFMDMFYSILAETICSKVPSFLRDIPEADKALFIRKKAEKKNA